MPISLRVRIRDKWYNVEVGDIVTSPVRVLVDGEPIDVDMEGLESLVSTPTETRASPVRLENQEGELRTVSAPLPGIIVSTSVRAGDRVTYGEEICVLEAMKMHQSLRSECAGTVTAVHVIQGQHVSGRQAIAEIAVD